MSVDGILNVNKPEGRTSFSIVAQLRRLSGEKHIGHTGTLDPFATGVLPVCFGQATKISRYVSDSNKSYRAQIELGISTDTYDREGKIIERKSFSEITIEQVKQALVSFQGVIEQLPPVYSAIKYQGNKLYKLARAGVRVQLKPRRVNIISIELVEYELPLITFSIECGKGTYIRSMAHDLGQKLGCGAYLKSLTRTKSGMFNIVDALSLSEIEEAFLKGNWKDLLYSLDYPLSQWRKVILDNTMEKAIKNGLSIELDEMPERADELICAYNLTGYFIALLKFNPVSELWHPERVFN